MTTNARVFVGRPCVRPALRAIPRPPFVSVLVEVDDVIVIIIVVVVVDV